MSYKIIASDQYTGSNEVYFDAKPPAAVRESLKALRMRWHSKKSCWYGFVSADKIEAAISGNADQVEKAASVKANRYGVKVGDIFSASWGWEQTNADFFQVIALVGELSVRVREVSLPMVDERPTGPMAADRTYKVVRDLLPAAPSSVFIKDQERGDLKRVKPGYYKDPEEANANCYIVLDSFANAYKCSGNTITEYESWYA